MRATTPAPNPRKVTPSHWQTRVRSRLSWKIDPGCRLTPAILPRCHRGPALLAFDLCMYDVSSGSRAAFQQSMATSALSPEPVVGLAVANARRSFKRWFVIMTLLGSSTARHLLDLGGDIAGNGLSRLFMTIAAAFAELERDRIRERITRHAAVVRISRWRRWRARSRRGRTGGDRKGEADEGQGQEPAVHCRHACAGRPQAQSGERAADAGAVVTGRQPV